MYGFISHHVTKGYKFRGRKFLEVGQKCEARIFDVLA